MAQKATVFLTACLLFVSILMPINVLIGGALPARDLSISLLPTMTISRARKQKPGTPVTIAGRVTVADEFGGPVFIQDGTAGIAVYDPALFPKVHTGDSLEVSGILSDYHTLLEISGDITYSILNANRKQIYPKTVDITSIGEKIEGQLVKIRHVRINSAGIFRPDNNYTVSDSTGSSTLRIDANTDIVNRMIPTQPMDIVAIVSEYDGKYELMPRNIKDLPARAYTPAGADVSPQKTLDIVTWNLEWFGSPGQNPSNDSLQVQNAASVMKHIGADLYALQEISNASSFKHLMSLLPGYKGFVASYSQAQKTAYIYKTSVIDSVKAGIIEPAGYPNWDYNWANGRPPLEFNFRATVDGITKRIVAINIHAKATTNNPSADYQRRMQASRELKQYLDQKMSNEDVIVLGDYNDDIDVSTYNDLESPYYNFVSDQSHYRVVTSSLSKRKFVSEIHGNNMIDHITINDELFSSYIDSTAYVEDVAYIPEFSTTTSDHFPVEARFRFASPNAAAMSPIGPQNNIYLGQNYPNPFNTSTNIPFHLDKTVSVTLSVFNLLGQRIATLINRQTMNGGDHLISFQSNGFPSGIYFYRLELSSGKTLTRKMTLMK